MMRKEQRENQHRSHSFEQNVNWIMKKELLDPKIVFLNGNFHLDQKEYKINYFSDCNLGVLE